MSKKTNKYLWYISISLFFVLSFLIIFLFFFKDNIGAYKEVSFALFVFDLLSVISFFYFSLYIYKSQSSVIASTINNFDKNLIASLGFGVIIISSDEDILWFSDFIKERFGTRVLNKKIGAIFPSFKIINLSENYETIVVKDNIYYELNYVAKKMFIIIKDVTVEQLIFSKYKNEKLVIGEIDIDNFQKYQSSLTEEELFAITSSVVHTLEKISQKYNFYFKQYSTSKFFIITNEKELKAMSDDNFSLFSNINYKVDNINISFSVGFGRGINDFSALSEISKEALQQSQNRGGNQITILDKNGKSLFFGSKSELSINRSRTLIRTVAQNFHNKINSKNIENVIIYGHKDADLDSIGASYAIYSIAKHFGKETYIQNQTFDKTGLKSLDKYLPLVKRKEIFISKAKANQITKKTTLVVIVDCAEKERTENDRIFEKTNDSNIFIFDHHRVTKIPENISNFHVYIESTSSSASEIVSELILFNNYNRFIDQTTAQLLLDGIYLDSNKFQKSTSSKTFMMASMLEELGASASESIEILKINNENFTMVSEILQNLIEVKPGYWLAAYNEEIPIDVISIAADEILRIANRKAAFVIAKVPKTLKNTKNIYKMSARGIDTNVQIIAEIVGGGGHFSAAAATSDYESNETFENFKDNIIQAIISAK
ncbi:MAG: DHH family phosphoesterase [Metamycoplasmataceae bacterium]